MLEPAIDLKKTGLVKHGRLNQVMLIIQNVDVKEEGARAYANVMKAYGFDASVGSRLD